MAAEAEKAKARTGKPRKKVGFIASLCLVVALISIYAIRIDAFAAIHWWPFAFWAPVTLLPFAPFFWKHGKGPLTVLLVLLVGIAFFDSGWRWFTPAGAREGLRVVSLNCNAGDGRSMHEAMAMDADLVLLQEVPPELEVLDAARANGYPFAIVGLDTAILSRSPFRHTIHEQDFVAGETVVAGRPVKAVSLRLAPPVFRLDLYNPAAWAAYREDAARRRDRMNTILGKAKPQIFGGDFNITNPRVVVGEYVESWSAAGKGWPGTGTNDYPFVRVDQIWGDPSVKFLQSFVRRTENSDHRMAVADFEFSGP